MKNAYGFKDICKIKFFSAAAGISWNWSGGTNIPKIADNRGILNLFLLIGIGCWRIFPFAIWHCGMVAEINGSFVPIEKDDDIGLIYPELAQFVDPYVLKYGV